VTGRRAFRGRAQHAAAYSVSVFGTQCFEHSHQIKHRDLDTDTAFALLQERGQQLLTIGHIATFQRFSASNVYVGQQRGCS